MKINLRIPENFWIAGSVFLSAVVVFCILFFARDQAPKAPELDAKYVYLDSGRRFSRAVVDEYRVWIIDRKADSGEVPGKVNLIRVRDGFRYIVVEK